jgi:anti-sigma regulatory factor (Ser/Thr protein kinase)
MNDNRLIVRSNKNSITILSEYLTCLLKDKISEEDDYAIHLAVEEVIVNIITHGYPDSEGIIEIVCQISDSDIIIHICDQAPFFNPLLLPTPDLDLNLSDRQIGGLGVYLIKSLMDEVNYKKTEVGNHLILKKRVTSLILK